jgi:2-isopropylmalate synthase
MQTQNASVPVTNTTGRYSHFSVPYLVDETLREGVERTAFPITVNSKMAILKKMVDAGVRDFIVGCGPEEPFVWDQLHQQRDAGILPSDTKATFIILLNCWETAFEYFSARKEHADWIASTVFSFGMITYRRSNKEFERAVEAFRSIGATQFKASILNNFRNGISEDRYAEICTQIDWAISLGIRIIRINDSVGSLQPHVTKWMCEKLVQQYPHITFCLHAHNDNGLAVANAMQSIQAGFQMIEGSLAGFGNRSGIAPLEQIIKLCKINHIEVGEHDVDLEKLVAATRAAENTFLQIPNVFRPTSGLFETNSNFGVLNIPDFLETNDEKEYFVNYVGLHPQTIRQSLQTYFPDIDISQIDDEIMWGIVDKLKRSMEESIHDVESRYKVAMHHLMDFYKNATLTPKQLAVYAENILTENENRKEREPDLLSIL